VWPGCASVIRLGNLAGYFRRTAAQKIWRDRGRLFGQTTQRQAPQSWARFPCVDVRARRSRLLGGWQDRIANFVRSRGNFRASASAEKDIRDCLPRQSALKLGRNRTSFGRSIDTRLRHVDFDWLARPDQRLTRIIGHLPFATDARRRSLATRPAVGRPGTDGDAC